MSAVDSFLTHEELVQACENHIKRTADGWIWGAQFAIDHEARHAAEWLASQMEGVRETNQPRTRLVEATVTNLVPVTPQPRLFESD